MNDRIKQLRLDLGLSQETFAKRLGLTRGAITNIELNKVEPKPRLVDLICETFNVSRAWLETGAGDAFIAASEDEEFHQILSDIEFSGDTFVRGLLKSYWALAENEKAAIRKLIDGLSK